MHQILTDYFQRFNNNNSKVKFDKFFTDHGSDFESCLPYLYNIEKTCERLVKALNDNEKICIYSDYDTDAVTATATMYWGLFYLGFKLENMDFYAPDRFTEGYGMNGTAIEMLCNKYDLIISVDCGINSVTEAAICNNKGIDLIITDHHHLTADLPQAFTVVNPRLQNYYTSDNPEFAQKDLYLSASVTGVGVAWFTVLWLGYWLKYKHNQPNLQIRILNELLPFVAIGTIADCQSVLESTNRILVRSGIKLIQVLSLSSSVKIHAEGLWNLLDLTGLRNQALQGYKICSSDLGYTLSPILNSSGRLSHASLSIDVLLGTGSSYNLATELLATNNKRKEETRLISEEVQVEASKQFKQGKKLIWLGNSNWSKGLIGLLASRIVSQFNLPVVVLELPNETAPNLSEDELKAVASLRAPEGYNLAVAMSEISELFIKFGGHPGAAGFSAKLENLDLIKQQLEVILNNQFSNLKPDFRIDFSNGLIQDLNENLELSALSRRKNTLWVSESHLFDSSFWADLSSLEPFGQDFLQPVLVFEHILADYDTISEGKHLRVNIYTGNTLGKITAIWFNYQKDGFRFENFTSGQVVWIAGRASQNAWKGKISWQIIVENMIFK